jgi:2-methylcitrate dehydratase PrpD
MADLTPQALADPAIRALALKVKCEADPDTAFPTYFSGGVEVILADGRTLRRHVRINSGAGDRAMTQEQVVAKFMGSASLTLSPAKAQQVCEAVLEMDRISARQLAAALRAG